MEIVHQNRFKKMFFDGRVKKLAKDSDENITKLQFKIFGNLIFILDKSFRR